MKTSDLTANQIEALQDIVNYHSEMFASKVAHTILTNGYFSEKQAAIINDSCLMGGIENHLPMSVRNIDDINAESARRQRPSSMRY